MMKFTALVQGERVDVEIKHLKDQVEARVGTRTYKLQVHRIGPSAYWFNWSDQSIETVVVRKNEGHLVSINGHQLEVELLDTRTALRRAAHQGQEGIATVRAPMPGRIVRILLQEGSDVEIHQGIAVMEAMKMQNEIRSPKRGKIRKLEVSEGNAVSSGDVIALVE